MKRPRHRLTPLAGVLALGLLLLGWPTLASLTSVADLFARGDYSEARGALQGGGEGAAPGEELLWRCRLAGNVSEAVQLLEKGLSDHDLPLPVQQRMTLELAEIHFARQDFRACLTVLKPAIDGAEAGLPGEAYLLAGLSFRLLGDLQSAREMLASIRPADPVFPQARFYLGDIGLQQGDNALALRYFESGGRPGQSLPHPDLQAGRWRALRAEGADGEAEGVLARLRQQSPGSLALLDINRILREETEELSARTVVQAPADTTATRPADRTGRYSLQIGAFSDRALALEFLGRYQGQLPDLRIDQEQDARGQFLYKVRSGSYVNPALARTEAARIKRSLGIDVMVADLSGTPR